MAQMGDASRLVAIMFASGMLSLFAADARALAQAGSIGGTIGQTDKSISGGEAATPAPHPRKPARPSGAGALAPKASTAPRDRKGRPPEAPRSESAGRESMPKTIRLIEHVGLLGDFTVTLQNVGGDVYSGTWRSGDKEMLGRGTKFTITAFTKDSIQMERNDDPALGAASGTYVGQRAGNSAHGTDPTPFSLGWDASW